MIKRPLPSRLAIGVALSMAAVAPTALAEAPESLRAYGRGLDVGPISIIPGLRSETYYDDNFFNAPTNELETWVQTLTPSLLFAAEDGANYYGLLAEYSETWVSDSHADDADRWRVRGDVNYELNNRNQIDLFAEYQDLYEPRGTGFSQGGTFPAGLNAPDESTIKSYGGAYTYGLSDHNRIEVRAERSDLEMDSRVAQTMQRDRSDESFGATFFWRVSPDTELFIEGENKDVEYDTGPVSGISLDSEEKTVHVGASWNITSLTTGTAQIGKTWKDFESNTRQDEDAVTWEVGLAWTPLTYSTFGVTTSKAYNETNTLGANTYTSSEWEIYNVHSWSDRFRSRLSYGQADNQYEGAGTAREDDIDTALVGVEYQMARWLTLGLQATRTEKDSNVVGPVNFDYDKNVYMLTIGAAL